MWMAIISTTGSILLRLSKPHWCQCGLVKPAGWPYNRALFANRYPTVIQRDDLNSVSLDQLRAAQGWQQQYKLIIQWGKLLKVKPEIRRPENLIRGCELPVWLVHQQEVERHYFAFDSDSSVMNGLAVLLLVQVNGKTRAELANLELQLALRELGLEKHLTPSRNNGLGAIIARIQTLLD
jgi:cysteine desulfuration protein SufE